MLTNYRGLIVEDLSNAFYPFDEKISSVIADFPFVNFSLINYCDVYDFTEFFFYTIVFPVIVLCTCKFFVIVIERIKRSTNSPSDASDNK
jgi:hypothetical protein